MTRIGSVSCKSCGYNFVKFCPQCQSANQPNSKKCRKCGAEFETKKEIKKEVKPQIVQEETPQKRKVINLTEEKIAKVKQIKTEQKQEHLEEQKKYIPQKEEVKTLLMYIDFINLEKVFEKYNKK